VLLFGGNLLRKTALQLCRVSSGYPGAPADQDRFLPKSECGCSMQLQGKNMMNDVAQPDKNEQGEMCSMLNHFISD